eukprot:COSAG01_NODE_14271_length_1474_cov_1.478545_1_plen_311_part_01
MTTTGLGVVLLLCCAVARPAQVQAIQGSGAAAGGSSGGAGGTAGQGYRHWQREHQRGTSLSDFSAPDPRTAPDEADEGQWEPALTPKFRWTQDSRKVYITVQVKGLALERGVLRHDRWWLNFSASGDAQRTVGARHDGTDARAQHQKRRVYQLALPLTRPCVPERLEQKLREGFTVLALRKETPNSDWTQLIKEPARSTYKRHMKVDFKMKYDRADEDEDEDVWAQHEYRVEKVTAQNVDDVLASSAITGAAAPPPLLLYRPPHERVPPAAPHRHTAFQAPLLPVEDRGRAAAGWLIAALFVRRPPPPWPA